MGRSSRRIRLQLTAVGLRTVRYQQQFFLSQLVEAFKKIISEDETKEKFEKKIVAPIKAATTRMLHAKKIMPEITPILTKFHEKVGAAASHTHALQAVLVVCCPQDAKEQHPAPSRNKAADPSDTSWSAIEGRNFFTPATAPPAAPAPAPAHARAGARKAAKVTWH